MIISLANHKGGTGKTTTTLNLAVSLIKMNKKVLVIDMDPQANLSYSLGVKDAEYDISDLMLKNASFEQVLLSDDTIDLIPAALSLYSKEIDVARLSEIYNYTLLKNELTHAGKKYDFILIDCPPSLSVYTTNALSASDYVLIPTILDVLSVQGIEQILSFIKHVKDNYHPGLNTLGVLGVIVDERRLLTFEILKFISNDLNVNIFNNFIRSNVKAAEAPSFGKSVIDYAPESNSAKDYAAFAKEFLYIIDLLSLSNQKKLAVK